MYNVGRTSPLPCLRGGVNNRKGKGSKGALSPPALWAGKLLSSWQNWQDHNGKGHKSGGNGYNGRTGGKECNRVRN